MVLCKYNEKTKQWEIIGGYSEVIASAVEKKIFDNNTQFVTPAINEHADNENVHMSEVQKAALIGENSAEECAWSAIQAQKGETIVRLQVQTNTNVAMLYKSTDNGVTWSEIPLGNASTVNGHSVESDVPANAVFPKFELNGTTLTITTT